MNFSNDFFFWFAAYSPWMVLTLASIFLMFMVVVLPQLIRVRQGKKASVITVDAEISWVRFETGYAAASVCFRRLDTGKTMKFDSRNPLILQFPEAGTKGQLTFRGPILYSFTWDGGRVVQDQPEGTDEIISYSDLF